MNELKIKAWIREWLILSIAVIFATWALSGIRSNGDVFSLMLVAALISFLNAFLRPLMLLISLPFIIATAGLGMIFVLWIINSFFLYFASGIFKNFQVDSFATAMLGALFISGAQLVLNMIFGVKPRGLLNSGFGENAAGTRRPPPARRQRRKEKDDGDVIDI